MFKYVGVKNGLASTRRNRHDKNKMKFESQLNPNSGRKRICMIQFRLMHSSPICQDSDQIYTPSRIYIQSIDITLKFRNKILCVI